MSPLDRDEQSRWFWTALPPEFQELGAWLTGTLLPELTAKVIAIGLPPEFADAIAHEAVDAVVGKITRGAEIYAAACQIRESRNKPS